MNQKDKDLFNITKIIFYMIIYIIKTIQAEPTVVSSASAENAAEDLNSFIKRNIHD